MNRYFSIVTLLMLFIASVFSCGNLFAQTFTKITDGDIVNNSGASFGSSWGDL